MKRCLLLTIHRYYADLEKQVCYSLPGGLPDFEVTIFILVYSEMKCHVCNKGLPDGLFSNQKYKIGYMLLGLGM
jgi:hypothetical protein